MSPTIPASSRSVATSSGRLEPVASTRGAVACAVWLGVSVIVALCAVAAPLSLRCLAGAVVAILGTAECRRSVLLRGPHSVRLIEWADDGAWRIGVGDSRRGLAAALGRDSFRMGTRLLALRFNTAEGDFSVLIDGPKQEPAALSRLCRRLKEESRGPSTRPKAAS